MQDILSQYDYSFPKKLVALQPASPRDSAKLLVYNRKTKQTSEDIFLNLSKYLPPRAVLVFNQTKVVPARLELKKETGGKVEVLVLETLKGVLKVLSDRKLAVPSVLNLTKTLKFSVVKQDGKYYYLKPLFPVHNLTRAIEAHGRIPLPPYLRHSRLSESKRKQEYQTIFAKIKGSVAAPTASLHFTKRLLKKLKASGFDYRFVTLHVGLGTFAPLEDWNFNQGRLHQEGFEIDKRTQDFLNRAKHQGRPIIAVGTTVVRTLESSTVQLPMSPPYEGGEKEGVYRLSKLSGSTNLFIQEGYKFKFIDGLITNFHVPKSSLLMLVSSLTGREQLFKLYSRAIKHNFRLFSFGDGMLIL